MAVKSRDKEPTQDAPYLNRIVATGLESVGNLLANPKNWRVHPFSQQEALAGVLAQVGWVQTIIVNQQTGNMIDGHLRAILADRVGMDQVPVTYVDLSEEEEAIILATFDPLGALAGRDDDKLKELLAECKAGDSRVGKLLNDLAGRSAREYGEETEEVPGLYGVIVECEDEKGQLVLLERLTQEGWKCRALVS